MTHLSSLLGFGMYARWRRIYGCIGMESTSPPGPSADARDVLDVIEPQSIDVVITSPPLPQRKGLLPHDAPGNSIVGICSECTRATSRQEDIGTIQHQRSL